MASTTKVSQTSSSHSDLLSLPGELIEKIAGQLDFRSLALFSHTSKRAQKFAKACVRNGMSPFSNALFLITDSHHKTHRTITVDFGDLRVDSRIPLDPTKDTFTRPAMKFMHEFPLLFSMRITLVLASSTVQSSPFYSSLHGLNITQVMTSNSMLPLYSDETSRMLARKTNAIFLAENTFTSRALCENKDEVHLIYLQNSRNYSRVITCWENYSADHRLNRPGLRVFLSTRMHPIKFDVNNLTRLSIRSKDALDMSGIQCNIAELNLTNCNVTVDDNTDLPRLQHLRCISSRGATLLAKFAKTSLYIDMTVISDGATDELELTLVKDVKTLYLNECKVSVSDVIYEMPATEIFMNECTFDSVTSSRIMLPNIRTFTMTQVETGILTFDVNSPDAVVRVCKSFTVFSRYGQQLQMNKVTVTNAKNVFMDCLHIRTYIKADHVAFHYCDLNKHATVIARLSFAVSACKLNGLSPQSSFLPGCKLVVSLQETTRQDNDATIAQEGGIFDKFTTRNHILCVDTHIEEDHASKSKTPFTSIHSDIRYIDFVGLHCVLHKDRRQAPVLARLHCRHTRISARTIVLCTRSTKQHAPAFTSDVIIARATRVIDDTVEARELPSEFPVSILTNKHDTKKSVLVNLCANASDQSPMYVNIPSCHIDGTHYRSQDYSNTRAKSIDVRLVTPSTEFISHVLEAQAETIKVTVEFGTMMDTCIDATPHECCKSLTICTPEDKTAIFTIHNFRGNNIAITGKSILKIESNPSDNGMCDDNPSKRPRRSARLRLKHDTKKKEAEQLFCFLPLKARDDTANDVSILLPEPTLGLRLHREASVDKPTSNPFSIEGLLNDSNPELETWVLRQTKKVLYIDAALQGRLYTAEQQGKLPYLVTLFERYNKENTDDDDHDDDHEDDDIDEEDDDDVHN
jgi:hypothetical protein